MTTGDMVSGAGKSVRLGGCCNVLQILHALTNDGGPLLGTARPLVLSIHLQVARRMEK